MVTCIPESCGDARAVEQVEGEGRAMTRVVLKNKPLIEALFELRWALPEETPEASEPATDFILLIGRMYERVKERYPFLERLPIADMPVELASFIPHYRFRVGENRWPLMQLGPGIVTFNDTEGYGWDNGFRAGIAHLLDALFAVSGPSELPAVQTVVLRYIDGLRFDAQAENMLDFLRDQMKMTVALDPALFVDTGIVPFPETLDVRLSFPSTSPTGRVSLRFARGNISGDDALIWETTFETTGEHAPQSRDDILMWADSAHTITSDWFFKIIEGELQRRFT